MAYTSYKPDSVVGLRAGRGRGIIRDMKFHERRKRGVPRERTGSVPRSEALTHRPVPLAIVGGGAAGLFAAATAARHRLGCLVFERKARIGA